ncbi:Protein of unknown function [Desulfatibacillum alkenivorans DSM 16219]|jgi:hypothetical protein|uniref:MetA-pathway of phenol degradation n=1 Tax=Desulfatibacillum alkenivorans DSM 16219 TaxID=1121393 RepID=A0A1M6IW65_9BACT|nr:DUF3187 family protein [Desulfatibacillum alkenivorans]SHJ38614.1 Protein of unknown function [Desulfatibacillum alkenivorans DSM 16219]
MLTYRNIYKGLPLLFHLAAIAAAFLFTLCPVKTALAGQSPDSEETEYSQKTETTPIKRFKPWAGPNVGYGLLRMPSQSPFQSLRLALLPRTPSTLGVHSWEFRLTQTLANTWVNEPGKYLMDYETLHSTASLSRRFHEILFELSFEEQRMLNGMLDGFIKNFHETLNLDQDGRDKAAYGEVNVDVWPPGGKEKITWEGGKGAFSQNIALVMQHNLTPGGKVWPAFSYSLSFRYDIWNAFDMERDFPVDMGVSFSLAKKMGPFHGYLVPGFFWYGSTRMETIEFERTQTSFLAGLEWNFHESASFLVQYLYSDGSCKDLWGFKEPSHEVTLGFKGRLTKRLVWELGILENIIAYDNSPDFGLHWGLTFRI